MVPKEKILDEAKKKGFLFEIEVQNLFDKRGWFTRPNARFVTEEGDIEIDLLTHKTISTKGGFNSIEVVCSCKKNEENPWVFYLIKRNVLDNPQGIIKFTSTCGAVGKSNYVTSAKIYWLNQDIRIDNLSLNNFNLRGKTYYPAFCDSKTQKGRQIYNSINVITKFFKYRLKEVRESNKQITTQNVTSLYCPIMVLDGELFGITNENGKVEIKEEKCIPLVIETGDIYLDKLLIYIIRKDYLEEFIIRLEEDLKLFKDKINLFLEKKNNN